MPERTTGSTEQTYLKLLAGFGPGRFIVGVLILFTLGLGVVPAASAQSQMTWGLHVSLVPAWFDPGEISPVQTSLVVMSALHDALVKPMPGQPLAPRR